MKYEHEPNCAGYEDCECFHVTISKEKHAAYERAVDILKCIRLESLHSSLHDFTDKDLEEMRCIIEATQ